MTATVASLMHVVAVSTSAASHHLLPSGLHHDFHGPRVDYVAVGLAAAVSWLVITGPGEAVLVAAAIAAAHHRVDIAGVIAVAWAGAALGGTAGWMLGRAVGRPLVTSPGPLRSRRIRMVRLGERLYEEHAALAVVVTPSWMAGIHRMRTMPFVLINGISALVWALVLGVGAFYAGPTIVEFVDDFGVAGLIVLCAVVVLAVFRRWNARRPG